MERRKNLEDLKPGDSVTLFNYGDLDSLLVVSRITKTMVIVENGGRYSLKDGRPIGTRSPWRLPQIKSTTDSDRRIIRHREMVARLRAFDYSRLSNETLAVLVGILDKE